jgi:hypothetical protein
VDVNLRRPKQSHRGRRDYYQGLMNKGLRLKAHPDEIRIEGDWDSCGATSRSCALRDKGRPSCAVWRLRTSSRMAPGRSSGGWTGMFKNTNRDDERWTRLKVWKWFVFVGPFSDPGPN